MAYSDEVLADTPLLYWRLNEATPGTGSAADSSGNARPGTYVASPTSVAGLLVTDTATAVTFDGSTQWVTSTYAPFALLATRSYECWLKRTSTTTADAFMGGDAATAHVGMRQQISTNTIEFFASTGDAAQTWTNAVAAGVVAHIVITFDGNTKVSRLYVNGVDLGSRTHGTDYPAAPGNFTAAKRGTVNDPYLGVMDEVAIYGSILSAVRVQAHYEAGFGRASYIASLGRRPVPMITGPDTDRIMAMYRDA